MSDGAIEILLVEDNPADSELVRHALGEARIPARLCVARDGEEALARLLDPSVGVPKLVLLDLKLPKISGLEVLRRLRADPRTAAVPTVVLTSSGQESDVRAAYARGANAYVVKPVDFARFLEVVADLGRFWVRVNTPQT